MHTIIVVIIAERPALEDHVVLHLEDVEGNLGHKPFGDGKVGDCAAEGHVAIGGVLLGVDDKGAEADAEGLVACGLKTDGEGLTFGAKVGAVFKDARGVRGKRLGFEIVDLLLELWLRSLWFHGKLSWFEVCEGGKQ